MMKLKIKYIQNIKPIAPAILNPSNLLILIKIIIEIIATKITPSIRAKVTNSSQAIKISTFLALSKYSLNAYKAPDNVNK